MLEPGCVIGKRQTESKYFKVSALVLCSATFSTKNEPPHQMFTKFAGRETPGPVLLADGSEND